ncbi:MAG: CutC family protein [Bacteroidetes bacterium]|nr:CutC family protein [Bacteroidota bacterium]
MKYEIEACVGSIESAIEAEKAGANRIELCDNLFEGGTTPSAATIMFAKVYLKIDTMVIIRPRGGDFCYSDIEFEIMKKDIQFCKNMGVKGVVIGILLEDGRVDKIRTKELVELAKPLKTCFHRAIDMTNDYLQALEDIIECGCDRILTSGAENKAVDGIENLSRIQEKAKGRIEIMVGSGVSSDNAKLIYEKTNITHYHLSGKVLKDGKMTFRHPRVSMGSTPEVSEYQITITDQKKILSLKEVLEKLKYD